MIAVNLNIDEKAYERVMYILNALPKKDIKIINKRVIEEIDPTTLDKNDFDYMSKKALKKLDKKMKKAKKKGLNKLQSYQEFKDEL
jgi:2-phosphoglycerate kinase